MAMTVRVGRGSGGRRRFRTALAAVALAGVATGVGCGSNGQHAAEPRPVGDGAASVSAEQSLPDPDRAVTGASDDSGDDRAARIDDLVVGDLDRLGAELHVPSGAIADAAEIDPARLDPVPLPRGVTVVSAGTVDFAAASGPQRSLESLRLVLAVPPGLDVDPDALRIAHHGQHPDGTDVWLWSPPDDRNIDRVELSVDHLPTVALVVLDSDRLRTEFATRRGLVELILWGGGRLPVDRADHLDLWLHHETEMMVDVHRHGATEGRFGYRVSADDWSGLVDQLGGVTTRAEQRWGADGHGWLEGYAKLRIDHQHIADVALLAWLDLLDRLEAEGWLDLGSENPLWVDAGVDGLGGLLHRLDELVDEFVSLSGRFRMIDDQSYAARSPEDQLLEGLYPMSAIIEMLEVWFDQPESDREQAVRRWLDELHLSPEIEAHDQPATDTSVTDTGDPSNSSSSAAAEASQRLVIEGTAFMDDARTLSRPFDFVFDLVIHPDRPGEGTATFSGEIPSADVERVTFALGDSSMLLTVSDTMWGIWVEPWEDGVHWVSFFEVGEGGLHGSGEATRVTWQPITAE